LVTPAYLGIGAMPSHIGRMRHRLGFSSGRWRFPARRCSLLVIGARHLAAHRGVYFHHDHARFAQMAYSGSRPVLSRQLAATMALPSTSAAIFGGLINLSSRVPCLLSLPWLPVRESI